MCVGWERIKYHFYERMDDCSYEGMEYVSAPTLLTIVPADEAAHGCTLHLHVDAIQLIQLVHHLPSLLCLCLSLSSDCAYAQCRHRRPRW